jgi:hypothetical protein
VIGVTFWRLSQWLKVQHRAIVVAERVQVVRSAPSGEHGAPGDAAVHHALMPRIPDRLRRDANGCDRTLLMYSSGVSMRNVCRNGLHLRAARREGLREIIRGDGASIEDAIHAEEERRTPHLD